MQSDTVTPTLDVIFETIHGFQRSAAIRSAVELDLFTTIADGATTSADIAARVGGSERGVRILCDYLTVLGLLTKSGDTYALGPEAGMFLNRHSPAYMASAIEFLLAPSQVDPFQELTAAIRQGGTAAARNVVAPEHPGWVTFAQAMASLMAFPAQLLADLLSASAAPSKVLDIAAGHGLYGIAVATRNPGARIVAVDWPQVLQVARGNARASGVADRYETLAGSAFDVDFGSGYDLALVVNFLHHFDAATIERFLAKVGRALRPGGRVAIVEFVPNEDRVSPRVPAQFSLMMLATTGGGDAYTYSQYERLLRSAGYASSEMHDLAPTYFRAVVGYK